MMKVLLVRTSSMGDLIHTFPAVTEFARHFPKAKLDWLAEEAFTDIAALHPFVRHVVPCALRRWRKQPTLQSLRQFRAMKTRLIAEQYDVVMDSQGLLKSAWLGRQAQGQAFVGFDRHSIREPFAAWIYDKSYAVSLYAGAITRYRLLFAQVFGYEADLSQVDFGLTGVYARPNWLPEGAYWVALASTSRVEKEWQETHWLELAKARASDGCFCVLPWGSIAERARAERFAAAMPRAIVAPKMSLAEAARLMANAHYAVGVDTGLLHMANAFDRPSLAIFTDSDPKHAGVIGKRGANLGGVGMMPSVTEALQALESLGL